MRGKGKYGALFADNISDVLREKFSSGQGVLLIESDMPDAALLLAIKQAISYGMPFTVVPASLAPEVGNERAHQGKADSVLDDQIHGAGHECGQEDLFGSTGIAPSAHDLLQEVDGGQGRERLDMLALLIEMELTGANREVGAQIIESLPKGATITDFVHACTTDSAQRLGTDEILHSLKPLLASLEDEIEDALHTERTRVYH